MIRSRIAQLTHRHPRGFLTIVSLILPILVAIEAHFKTDQFSLDDVFFFITFAIWVSLWAIHGRKMVEMFSDKSNNELNFQVVKKEFLYIDKIINIGIVIVLGFLSSSVLVAYGVHMDSKVLPVYEKIIINTILSPSLTVLLTIHFKLRLRDAKQFPYYYAFECVKEASTNTNEIEQTKSMMLGIRSYNVYLNKNMKLEINQVEKSYEGMISTSSDAMKANINKILVAFQKNDKLEPFRCLTSLQKSDNIPPTIKFMKYQFKEGAPIVLGIIGSSVGVVSAVIQLISRMS